MKVLKPEIDKISEKHKKKDPMKVQQETMGLYRKAGVSPMGGCLPMLFQFPILIAMFRFFPASIELRQKSFLWADDLSSFENNCEDTLYNQAVSIVTNDKRVSISYIQRKLQIGYNRAARIVEEMEETGIVSAPNTQGNSELL